MPRIARWPTTNRTVGGVEIETVFQMSLYSADSSVLSWLVQKRTAHRCRSHLPYSPIRVITLTHWGSDCIIIVPCTGGSGHGIDVVFVTQQQAHHEMGVETLAAKPLYLQ